MAEIDDMQFLLSPDYVDEEFGVLFADQADSDPGITPTDSQKIGLLLLAGLTKEHAEYTTVVVKKSGKDLLVTLTRS